MSWECEKCGSFNLDTRDDCLRCSLDTDGTKPSLKSGAPVSQTVGSMGAAGTVGLIATSTTPEIPNKKIAQSMGAIFGEVILGSSFFKEVKADVTDFFGARSGGYETNMKKARKAAMEAIIEEARTVGADAIVGLSIGYESIGDRNMLMVCASGTAVKLEK